MGWSFFNKKKEEPEIDPLHDLVLSKMKKGWMLDYDLKTWEVIAVHKYDWGDGEVTREWELNSANETLFLEIDIEDGGTYSLCKKVPIGKIGGNIKSYMQEHDDPPSQINYMGETFYLDEEGAGLFHENGAPEEQEMLYWDFVDEKDEKFVTIEQWSETEFEAYEGWYAEEYQFTNILPRENS